MNRMQIDTKLDIIVQKAIDAGFSYAGILYANTLTPREEIRDMCAVNTCGLYGKCWTCPPACGTLEEHITSLSSYQQGILVQTTTILEDDFDYPAMEACSKKHKTIFSEFLEILKQDFSDVLALSAGGCTLCPSCTYPNQPCRNPDRAIASMEAYGLWVSEICKLNHMKYYYGSKTMTYTGCYLFL